MCGWTFHIIMEDTLSHQESVQISLYIAHICPTEFFLQQVYANKWFYKEFSLLGLSVPILLINEVGGTCKRDIKIAPKSAGKISDLDCRKLSLKTFWLWLDSGKFMKAGSVSCFAQNKITEKPQTYLCDQFLPQEWPNYNILMCNKSNVLPNCSTKDADHCSEDMIILVCSVRCGLLTSWKGGAVTMARLTLGP